MPRISGILETSLYLEDLLRAVAFYSDLLGFEPFFHDPRMAALGVPGGQVLLLFQRGATTEPAPGPGGGFIPPHHGEGSLHLCFAIPFGELTAWETHLRDHDVAVESRLHWARDGTSLYFRVSEGNSLEVATPKDCRVAGQTSSVIPDLFRDRTSTGPRPIPEQVRDDGCLPPWCLTCVRSQLNFVPTAIRSRCPG